MLSIATDEAVQMLEAGWIVRIIRNLDVIEWRSPRAISGSAYHSLSLDRPPVAAVEDARKHGEIQDHPRRPGRS